RERLRKCLNRLDEIEAPLKRRLPLRGLARVALLGPPNAGKSSLFKRLVPSSRVLTSSLPGTTRDLIEGEVNAQGFSFLLFDTPGIMGSRDPLERLARSRLLNMMGRMDAAVLVFDASSLPSRVEVRSILKIVGSRPCIAVMNKSDLSEHPAWAEIPLDLPALSVSALTGEGIDSLLSRLAAVLPMPSPQGGSGIDFQMAHAIQSARNAISTALQNDWECGLELVAMEVRDATDAIGSLSTAVTDEEILNAIFSRFCIGK
ncbi:MAG: GTPase, partial [Planctomycetota bacterium]